VEEKGKDYSRERESEKDGNVEKQGGKKNY